MNWLAHIFISEDHIDYQLGNFLADPLKGKSWEGASKEFNDGIKMHGSIDLFTDSHEFVSKSKSRLGARGYLKGVVIDITYDHLLMKNWDLYSNIGLTEFVSEFYENALIAIGGYPEEARSIVTRLINSKNLTSYGSIEGLGAAFERIDERLSQRLLARESAISYLPLVEREIPGIEEDFKRFFPDLIQHFRCNSEIACGKHWLKN